MSLLFIEGFEGFWHSGTGLDATYSPWDECYSTEFGGVGIGTSYGRNSLGATHSNYSSSYFFAHDIGDQGEIVIGMAVKPNYPSYTTLNHTYNKWLQFLAGGAIQNTITFSNTGLTLELRTGDYNGSVLATASAPLIEDVWQYVEIKLTIDPTVGAIEIRSNGVTILSATGLNTDPLAVGVIDKVKHYATYARFHLDDIYILNTSGSQNNDFLGDCKVVGCFPTADGTNTDWIRSTGTAGYPLIDDPIQSSTDGFITAFNDGDKDTYTFGFNPDGRAIYGVQLSAFSANPEGGSIDMNMITISDVTEDIGATFTVDTVRKRRNAIWELDPNTSLAWDEDDLALAEFGFETVIPT